MAQTSKADTSTVKNKLQQQQQRTPATNGQQNSVQNVNSLLIKMRSEIVRALPKHLDPDRMIRIVLTVLRTNPRLLDCNIQSLLAAVMQASQLGLEPGLLGHCYFIPFRNKKKNTNDVQFVIGYKGLIDLVRRTGEVTSIVANEVYTEDKFVFEYGLNEKLEHVPLLSANRGKIRCFYAYARFKDGGHAFTVIPVEEINRIRDSYSKSKDDGPWVNEYISMAKKTAIRQLIKYMPISVEVQNILSQDETTRENYTQEPHAVDSEYINIPYEISDVTETSEPVAEPEA